MIVRPLFRQYVANMELNSAAEGSWMSCRSNVPVCCSLLLGSEFLRSYSTYCYAFSASFEAQHFCDMQFTWCLSLKEVRTSLRNSLRTSLGRDMRRRSIWKAPQERIIFMKTIGWKELGNRVKFRTKPVRSLLALTCLVNKASKIYRLLSELWKIEVLQ